MSALKVMDRAGTKELTWTADDDAAVKAATELFAKAKADGFLAYKVDEAPAGGEVSQEVIREFDRTAAQIVMTPQYVGG
jgi:hypothetical protein